MDNARAHPASRSKKQGFFIGRTADGRQGRNEEAGVFPQRVETPQMLMPEREGVLRVVNPF